jgi:hypothetical protein
LILNDAKSLHEATEATEIRKLEFALEGAVENGGEEGVEFGGGFGLQGASTIYLRLQCV